MPKQIEIKDGAPGETKLLSEFVTTDYQAGFVNTPLSTAAPVNAVAASRVLTVSGLPTAGHTVTIDGRAYTWVSALSVAGVAADAVLTLSDVAVAAETVTINGVEYAWVTALTEVKASGTLTLTANMTDGNRVVIGSTTYTFREALTVPAVPYEVLIAASASDTIDNLIAAINAAAGAGTTYATGTVAHTLVTAAVGAGDTMTATAKTAGTAGNSIATLEYSGASWGAATLSGGIAPVANEVKVAGTAELCINNLVAAATGAAGTGTNYSTGTTQPSSVTVAKASASTVTVTANTAGTAGNAIEVAEAMTNASWDDTVLTGGVDAVAEAAYTVLLGVSAEACIDNLVAAITYDAGEGTNEGSTYGTGTEAHTTATAAKTTASTMTATASTKGTSGNAIVLAENDANTSWASGLMTGGVNGTVGIQDEVRRDASYLYLCVAPNTVADTNWRRISLGSAY